MGGVKPVDVHSVKIGRYIVMEGVPCVVKKIDKSAPGKHGHAKFRIESIGVFDGKKRVEVKSSHTRCEVPIIEKKSGQVLSVNGDRAQVMDSNSYEIFDIDIPADLKSEVKDGVGFLYWDIFDTKLIKQIKKE